MGIGHRRQRSVLIRVLSVHVAGIWDRGNSPTCITKRMAVLLPADPAAWSLGQRSQTKVDRSQLV